MGVMEDSVREDMLKTIIKQVQRIQPSREASNLTKLHYKTCKDRVLNILKGHLYSVAPWEDPNYDGRGG